MVRFAVILAATVGLCACSSYKVDPEDSAGLDAGGDDGRAAPVLGVCGRGDQDTLSARLAGGSLMLTFRGPGQQVLDTHRIDAAWPAGVDVDFPQGALSVDVSGVDSGGSQVAYATGPVTAAGACVCLALDGEFDPVCAGVECQWDGAACAYAETAAGEPCGLVGDEPFVLDDSGPCFTGGGPSDYLHAEAVGWESTLLWTDATDFDHAENFGAWDLNFERAGRYRVEAYIEDAFAESHMASYQIMHGSVLDRVIIDQEPLSGWATIAELDFHAGDAQWIRLPDNTGEPEADTVKLVFDALRLTPL